eukprot:gnl/TRDRNA2_/TRDRNA2_92865_c0_seq1.p1 gnl/TRDRNA2_/TRDRNA2_92865_c0~~gnl/TRDRNA2_/TRDRNA2_92865_c0_seq1.p1  ORF type:complete len:384 (+),score=50.27 gnl/TRDRNA2_/TRDRNA2_92865_c0_seq1:103-1254(+)
MLYCLCGYSCGTKAALDRHIAKFPDAESEHGAALAPPGLPPRTIRSVPDIHVTECDGEDNDNNYPFASMTINNGNYLSQTLGVDSMGTCSSSPSSPSSSSFAISPSGATTGKAVRLLLVRHAQSANKQREKGEAASLNPGLTDLGSQQADALGKRLARDLRAADCANGCVTIVSSPMRRCLLTILPAVQQIDSIPPENRLVHGAAYEYGCAGTAYTGTTEEEVVDEFPDFRCVNFFGPGGTWDYVGSSEKEDQEEAKARVVRLGKWVFDVAIPSVQKAAVDLAERSDSKIVTGGTVILVMHQTLADAFCHLLLDESLDKWVYGEIKYRLLNAAFTEILVKPDGRLVLGAKNDSAHILHLAAASDRSPTASMSMTASWRASQFR